MSQTEVEIDRRSDAELIASARAADPAIEDGGAYAELFRRHSAAARAAARALVGRRGDIDDLVAEGFARVLNAIRRGGGPELAFRPYLLTCIRNVFYDRARHESRVEVTDEMPDVVDAALEARAASGDDRALVAEAFATLPERWQLVLWHTEIEGRPAAEVAPLLGLAPNAVAALSYRAREGLREAYLQAHLHRTPPASCGEARLRLGGYARESLSSRDTTMVAQHLERCERCRAILVELRDVAGSLRAVVAPTLLGAPLAAYLARLLPGKATVLAQQFSGRSRRAQAAAAGAAILVVALAAVGAAALNRPAERPQLASTPTTSTVAPTAPARTRTATTRRPATTSPKATVASPPKAASSASSASSAASTVPNRPASGTAASATSVAATRPTVLGTSIAATTVPRSTTTRAPKTGTVSAPVFPNPTQADLSVSLAPLGPAVPGHDVYLSAVVTNAGPDAATAVVVEVTLPPSLVFHDATPATWQCGPVAGTTVTCRLPLLDAPASTTLVLHTMLATSQQHFRTAAALPGPVTVSATVRSATGDTAAAANTASIDVTPSPVGGFAALYAAVDNGDVLVVGNTLMCDEATSCTNPAKLTNNDLPMAAIGGDATGVSASSSAELALPADATVTKAWLFWGAKRAPADTGTAAYTAMRLTGPRTAPAPGAPEVVELGTGVYGEVDVTETVRGAREGTYTFASLDGYTGHDNDLAGGWSLIVVTHQASAPERVMVVMDGLIQYDGATRPPAPASPIPLSIPLGGLGPVSVAGRIAQVGIVAWDGDRGPGTDSMTLDVGGVAVPVWDEVHPFDDVMTSCVSVGGTRTPGIEPNTLGFDASLIDVRLDGSTPPPAPGTATLAPIDPPSGALTLNLSASEAIWLGALTLSVPT